MGPITWTMKKFTGQENFYCPVAWGYRQLKIPDDFTDFLALCIEKNDKKLFIFRALLEKGVVAWRLHEVDRDLVVMSDVDVKSGRLLINSFVHITRKSGPQYQCECDMYRILGNINEEPTCMHIKFFMDYIEPCYSDIFLPQNDSDSFLLRTLKSSWEYQGQNVIRLDHDTQYHRFSVLTSDAPRSYSIVYMEKNRLSCKGGLCSSRKGHKRKEQRLGSPDDCPHLQMIAQHREVWRHLLPGQSGESLEQVIYIVGIQTKKDSCLYLWNLTALHPGVFLLDVLQIT